MAGTVIARKRKDGTTAYRAELIVYRNGKVAHRESQTFDRRQAAEIWVGKREKEIDQPGGLQSAKTKTRGATLGDAVDRYLAESRKAIGRTKAQALDTIKRLPISDRLCEEISSPDLIAFAASLSEGREPQTVANYMSHLGAVFAIAKPAWGFPLDPAAMSDASKVAKRLGLTAKSKSRERRPTADEINRLMAFFKERARRRPSSNPMHRVIPFALYSTRRLEEITRIRWADLESDRVLVRDMKNPGEKMGNDIWCGLPPEAVEIANLMPKVAPEIFPFSTDAISAAFTRACKVLGIDDLHFHDLRHEGVSRLFELGWDIPHVATVSGHRSWSSLKRYTHIRQSGDKWAGDWWR